MTDEEMYIAIAEACGISNVQPGPWYGYNAAGDAVNVRDCLNDLNAMHEAWKVGIQTAGEDEAFCRQLRIIACPQRCDSAECSYVINATARQRAEAFLRTIGKWKD